MRFGRPHIRSYTRSCARSHAKSSARLHDYRFYDYSVTIYHVFYMLLPKQDSTKKKCVNKVLELDIGKKDSKKYKVKVSWNNIVYITKLKLDHLSKILFGSIKKLTKKIILGSQLQQCNILKN